jgi:hypothetical protein
MSRDVRTVPLGIEVLLQFVCGEAVSHMTNVKKQQGPFWSRGTADRPQGVGMVIVQGDKETAPILVNALPSSTVPSFTVID